MIQPEKYFQFLGHGDGALSVRSYTAPAGNITAVIAAIGPMQCVIDIPTARELKSALFALLKEVDSYEERKRKGGILKQLRQEAAPGQCEVEEVISIEYADGRIEDQEAKVTTYTLEPQAPKAQKSEDVVLGEVSE